MIKQYIKQAWQMLKENRLISSISITGTAISITMIMMVVLVLQVQVANYYPEEHRDRMLYVENGTLVRMKENTGNWNSGNMSIEAVKECFYTLQSPEFVTAYAVLQFTVSLPDKRNYMAHPVKLTDTGFWKVFSFHFVAGAPFTEADVASGVPQAVITEPLARRLFGTIDNIIGKEIRLDVKPYRVCGVVEEVSKAAASAFADVWIPYTTNESCQSSFNENMVGSFRVLLLAKAQGDFDVIRQELKQQITRYNATKEKYEISFFENPITQWDKAMGTDGQNFVDWKDFWLETGGAMLVGNRWGNALFVARTGTKPAGRDAVFHPEAAGGNWRSQSFRCYKREYRPAGFIREWVNVFAGWYDRVATLVVTIPVV